MPDCGDIGEIREKYRTEKFVRLAWWIPKFFLQQGRVSDWYCSPSFHFFDMRFFLRIYPNGDVKNQEWVLVELVRWEWSVKKPVRFSLGFEKVNGAEEMVIRDEVVPDVSSHLDQRLFLRKSYLLTRKAELCLAGGALAITCALKKNELLHHPMLGVAPESQIFSTLKTYDPMSSVARQAGCARCYRDPKIADKKLITRETQTEDVLSSNGQEEEYSHFDIKEFCTLRKSLKSLLVSGDDHDVTFKVKNKEFKAHRCMLRARSSVFAAMFKYEMKESTDDPIPIIDCDPEAFGEFIQYVYTGKVEKLSPSNALGLYYISDKYDFSGLKEICVDFLKASLSTTAVCDVISLSARHGETELLQCAIAFFSKYMEEIMITVEWQRFLMANPIQASELCLTAVKSSYKKIEE